jgi:nucleoid-associated protein YgaU
MQKDLKIGLALGLVLVASVLLWLATRPSLSPIARMSRTPEATPAQESFEPATEANITDNQPPAISPQPESPDSPEGVPDTAKYEQAEKIKTQKFHIVLKKQTLSAISQKYYGSPGNWKKILDANRNTIKDPNKLIPGTKLIIPD